MSVDAPDPDPDHSAESAVLALVREEWPDLDAERVSRTRGEIGELVALVVEHTGQTRVATRRQVAELVALSHARPAHGERGAGSRPHKGAEAGGPGAQFDDLLAAIKRIEGFAADEARKMLPVAETRVRQNLWVSLLLTLGLGFILGLWLSGGRRRS